MNDDYKTICPNCDGYDGENIEFPSSTDTCPECGHRLANLWPTTDN